MRTGAGAEDGHYFVPYARISATTNIMLTVMTQPREILLELAARVRRLRLDLGWTQDELARRSGVAFSTLRLFERTGRISLERLVLVARALGALDGFEGLFQPPPAMTLADVEQREAQRVRGRRRRS